MAAVKAQARSKRRPAAVAARRGALALALLALLAAAAAASDSEIVAIVHPSNPLRQEISVRELRLVYGLYQRAWKGGRRVELVLPQSGSTEMAFMLERVFHKANPSELSRYYIQAVFQNRLVEEPPVLGAREAVAMVRAEPGAIALLRRSEIGSADAVRVLEIRE